MLIKRTGRDIYEIEQGENMFTKLNSISFLGLKTIPVEIEVDIQVKVPEFEVVGMAGLSVKESVKRIESAIQNSGLHFPGKRIIVNLAPAGIKKAGALFDLPIAVGILNENFEFEGLAEHVIVGELSLDGHVRPIHGALPIALKAKQMGIKKIVCPAVNAGEMAIVEGIDIIPVRSLNEAIEYFGQTGTVRPHERKPDEQDTETGKNGIDMNDIKGQNAAKRALEVCAAGGHNALMIGPPGTGKTMIAKRIPTILPGMTLDESLETTMIYSVAGMVDPEKPLIRNRPFRTPHHTATDISIIGGGKMLKPGEVSLAHNGVLFLDEFQQFRPNVLQVLRQPMEDEKVSITRADGTADYPANFMLIAALNPSRKNTDIEQWDIKEMKDILTRLSGPLLDRIDIQVQVSRIKYDQLHTNVKQETSAQIRERVIRARNLQMERFRGAIYTNSQMSHKMLEEHCSLTRSGEGLIRLAMEKFMLSIRVYDKILKISRTIADLDGESQIQDYHLSEALQYRVLDRVLNFIN